MKKTLKRVIALIVCVAVVFSISISVLAETKTATLNGASESVTFVCKATYVSSSGVKGVTGSITPTETPTYSMDTLKITTRLYLDGSSTPKTSTKTATNVNKLTYTCSCYPESMVNSGNATLHGEDSYYGRFTKTCNC